MSYPTLPKYANTDDRHCVAALLDAILADSETNTISIELPDYDEPEIALSRDVKAIKTEMASTGIDTLVVHTDTGEYLGWFNLIYCNGSEGDSMILISDYSANEYSDRIYEKVNAVFPE